VWLFFGLRYPLPSTGGWAYIFLASLDIKRLNKPNHVSFPSLVAHQHCLVVFYRDGTEQVDWNSAFFISSATDMESLSQSLHEKMCSLSLKRSNSTPLRQKVQWVLYWREALQGVDRRGHRSCQRCRAIISYGTRGTLQAVQEGRVGNQL
jgi:hypothetical protein